MSIKFDQPWWTHKAEEHAARKLENVIFDEVSSLSAAQTGRRNDNNIFLKLYGKSSTDGMIAKTYKSPTLDATLPNKLKMNIIKSIVDSGQARIAKSRPRVSFLTNNADRTQQEKAKNLEKFVFGYFLKNKIYKQQQTCFRDAEICDLSALHTFVRDGQIVSERVFANELLIGEMDGYYGDPQTMYRYRWVPKWSLAQSYPEYEHDIEHAIADFTQLSYRPETVAGERFPYVIVVEAWKRAEPGHPGRYVRAINNKVLEDKEYDREYFPFVFHRWTEPTSGFYGESLTSQLVDVQVEINRLLRDIQTRLHLGTPKIFIKTGTKFVKNHWSNEFGAMIEYAGDVPPRLEVFQTIHPELIQMLNWQMEQAYQKAGLNELFSQGAKPAGVTAAVAMREMDDIETARFALVAQSYEDSYIELAQHYIDCARELSENGDIIKIQAPARSFMEEIDWDDVNMDNDMFLIQKFPSSMLPERPEGRMQKVQEMIEAGFIDREQALQLLDLPDTEHWVKRELSGVAAIDRRIEKILDKGQYVRPTPFLDLELAVNRATEELNLAEDQKFSSEQTKEDRLDLLRRFIQECKTLGAAPMPAQPSVPVSDPAAVELPSSLPPAM